MGFFLLQISTNTVSNVQSQAFSDNGYAYVGFILLGLSYASLAVGCIVAPQLVEKFGAKFCMICGSAADTLWIIL